MSGYLAVIMSKVKMIEQSKTNRMTKISLEDDLAMLPECFRQRVRGKEPSVTQGVIFFGLDFCFGCYSAHLVDHQFLRDDLAFKSQI